MLKKIFGHSFLYTIANHIPMLANIVILPLITPFLTRDDYAVYGIVLAYLGALQAFSLLGSEVLFQNAYFKEKIKFKSIWSHLLGALAIWRIVYISIISLILFLVLRNKLEEDLWIVLAMLIIPRLFFELTRSISVRLCQYDGKHQRVYVISFITGIVTIATSFVSIYYYNQGFKGWIYAAVAGGLVEFVLHGYLLHFKEKIVPRFDFKKSFVKRSLKICLPVIPHYYSSYLLESSDRVVLDVNKVSMVNIGEYNLAYSFSNYFARFNSTLNTILSPIYFRVFGLENDEESDEFVSNLTLMWFVFIAFVCYIICLWCKEIFLFLYRNPEFNEAYKLLPFIIVGMLYRPLYVACVDKAIYKEKTKSVLKISVVGGVLNLVLNMIFVPIYGVEAALITTLVAYLYMGFSGFFIKEIRSEINLKYNPIYFFLAMVAVFALAQFSIDLSIFYKILLTLGSVLLIGLLYLFKGKEIISNLNKKKLI